MEETSHALCTQFPPSLTSSMRIIYLSQLMKQYCWVHYYILFINISPYFIQIFLALLNILFLSQDPIYMGFYITFSCRVSLGSSVTVTVVQTCLVFDDLDSLEVYWSGIL